MLLVSACDKSCAPLQGVRNLEKAGKSSQPSHQGGGRILTRGIWEPTFRSTPGRSAFPSHVGNPAAHCSSAWNPDSETECKLKMKWTILVHLNSIAWEFCNEKCSFCKHQSFPWGKRKKKPSVLPNLIDWFFFFLVGKIKMKSFLSRQFDPNQNSSSCWTDPLWAKTRCWNIGTSCGTEMKRFAQLQLFLRQKWPKPNKQQKWYKEVAAAFSVQTWRPGGEADAFGSGSPVRAPLSPLPPGDSSLLERGVKSVTQRRSDPLTCRPLSW